MSATLKGKIAIVTGGTRGIGFAIARSLASDGAEVVITGRSQNGIDRAVKELRDTTSGKVSGGVCDVSKPEEVSNFFDELSRRSPQIDVLVNNAGIGIFRPVGELSIEDWKAVIDTNLTGAFLCARAALPLMRRGGGGFIVNISSLAGRNPFAGGAAYNASKFGLNGFSEALMLDHRHDNIRVSYVMPGSVDTEFGASRTGISWKIAPEDIAEIVMNILHMADRTLISRVEVRPSKPPK